MSVTSESKAREGEEDEEETSIGIGISSNNTARTENTTMSSPRRDRTTAPSTPAKKGCENISLFRVGFSLLSTRKIRAHFSLSLSRFCAFESTLKTIRRFFYITTGENDKAKVKTKPTVSSIRHDVLLHKFKLFDHDLRYGPTAGLTRRERLELAIANKIGLNENALTVQNAFESKIIDENDPLWKYSVWKNNPGQHVDF